LNVVPMVLPPLREHMEDVPLLSERFLQRSARKHGVHILGLAPDCRQALMNHHWPGNVRELQNVIERAVILCPDGGSLRPDHLGMAHDNDTTFSKYPRTPAPPFVEAMIPAAENIRPMPEPSDAVATAAFEARQSPFSPLVPDPRSPAPIPTLWEVEKQLILAALERCSDNRTHAAKMIGVSLRTLRNKLSEYRSLNALPPARAAEEAPEPLEKTVA
jgi:DNA-binding NtrC family response regulator